jgi:hypothetical protein
VFSPCLLQDASSYLSPLPVLHSFQSEASIATKTAKKAHPSILRFTGAVNYGWGIHINEGPNYSAIGVVNFSMMVVSGLVAFL